MGEVLQHLFMHDLSVVTDVWSIFKRNVRAQFSLRYKQKCQILFVDEDDTTVTFPQKMSIFSVYLQHFEILYR